MTVFDLCSDQSWEDKHRGFRIVGKRNIVWESAVYAKRADKVIIARVVEANDKNGKPFLMGLKYISRYVPCHLKVELVKK